MFRNRLLIMTVFGFTLVGCGTTGGMGGGPFQPRIKVAGEFVHAKKSSGLNEGVAADEARRTNVLTESDFYVEAGHQRVKRFFIIKTHRLDRDFFWKATDYNDPSVIEHGVVKLGGKDYEYYSRFSRIHVPSGKGYTFPQCIYQVWWQRDLTNEVRFQFSYAEDVTQYGMACGDFSDGPPFTDKVKEYILAFNERSMNAFQLSP